MAGVLKSLDLERAGILETMTPTTTPSKKVKNNVIVLMKKGLSESTKRQPCPVSSNAKDTPRKKNATPFSTSKSQYESKHCKTYGLHINDENSANNNTPVEKIAKPHPHSIKADGVERRKVKNSSRNKLKRKRSEEIEKLLDSPNSSLNANSCDSDDENEEKAIFTSAKKKVVYNISRGTMAVKNSIKCDETINVKTKQNAKSRILTLGTFERQSERSPKRMKVSYDPIFDSRYGMCMLQ